MWKRPKLLLTVAILVSMAPRVGAFGEDVCFVREDSTAFDDRQVSCAVLPASCPPGNESLACVAALIDYDDVLRQEQDEVGNGGRSTLHMDATYLIAQLVGFDATDAYWVAAYDEATQSGRYVPRDIDGRNLVDPAACNGDAVSPASCDLITQTIDGLAQSSFGTGGIFFHVHAPYNGLDPSPVPGIDGKHPDPSDAEVELFLAHLRRWAFEEGILCAGGLTSVSFEGDYATGGTCFTRAPAVPGRIGGGLGFPQGMATPLDVDTGLQLISTQGPGPVTSDTFATFVGAGRVDAARLGIYLHTLQDRVANSLCIDASHLTGPRLLGEFDFVADLTSPQCEAGLRDLRSAWDVGSQRISVPELYRMPESALPLTWDELLAYARSRGFARRDADSLRERIIKQLLTVLEEPDASERVRQLRDLACAEGVEPLPGHGPCPVIFDDGFESAPAEAQRAGAPRG